MAENLDQEKSWPPCVGMVVDDDVLLRETVVAILEEVCDEVYQASDGLEGLEVLGTIRTFPWWSQTSQCRASMASPSRGRQGASIPT